MTDAVYLALRQAIVGADLAAGTHLTEAALATKYGVSRTPVREALRRLQQDGLVERASSGGLRVRVWTEEEVFDLYDVRIVLETQAARVAARRRTELDLVRLRQTCETMAAIDMTDVSQMRATNLSYHEAVWRASHNKSIVEVLTRLQMQILRHPANTLTYPGRWPAILEEHRELIDAIERGDADDAGALAASHMAAARDIRLQLYAENRSPDITSSFPSANH